MSIDKKQYALTALAAVGLFLSGCQAASIKTESVSKELAAHPLSARPVGYKRITKDLKGKVQTVEVVSVENDIYQYKTDDGHQWQNYPNPILPSPTFSGADWGSGTQEISKEKGELFPLAVGNKMSFTLNGKSSKYPDGWTEARKCEVKSQERVSVAAGEFDAFKVVCNSQSRSRVYFFAPEINDIVYYRNTHRTDATRTDGWELVEMPSDAT